jgi:alkylation response protein AidB-like acyl-CoA dehydrogenase
MDFGFTAEQEMLRDAARKFLASEYPATVARAAMASATAHDAERWRRLAALGWTAILVPEELGGQSGNFLDMAVVLEETGKALVPGPFFASAVLGTVAVREAGTPEQQARWLPALARGDVVMALASGSTDEDAGLPVLSTRGDELRLEGHLPFVLDAHVADAIVVAAHTAGAVRLVLVERAAAGLTVTALQTVDMTRRLCTVELRDVPCTPLGDAAAAARARGRAVDHACAGLALELVGVGQRALEMSVAYANQRTQFGRPIGSFQAIKHKCVDMMVAVETARSLAYYAAWAVSEDAADRRSAAAMAKAYCGEMAKTVTSEAIQVHGGIGFTWEHDLHLYYRRALAADAAFGAAPMHRETIMRAVLG